LIRPVLTAARPLLTPLAASNAPHRYYFKEHMEKLTKSVDMFRDIKDDHRKVKDLFADWNKTNDNDQKQKIAQEIIRELSVHAATEEMVLYPLVKEKFSGDFAAHFTQQHTEVETILYDLDQMTIRDEGYVAKMNLVIQDVQDHVAEEEKDLLPKLEALLDDTERDSYNHKWTQRKMVAPTRPHPSAPKNSGAAATLAAATAMPLDAAKDMSRFTAAERQRHKEENARQMERNAV